MCIKILPNNIMTTMINVVLLVQIWFIDACIFITLIWWPLLFKKLWFFTISYVLQKDAFKQKLTMHMFV